MLYTPDEPLPPRRWTVPGLLQPGTVTVIGGKGGRGKSQLAQQLAVAVATGTSFLTWPAPERAAAVLVLNGEDDRDEQRRRLNGSVVVAGLDEAARDRLRENIRAVHEPRITLLVQELSRSGKKTVKPTPLFGRLCELVEEHGVEVLVIDPLVEASVGFDESGNNDMAYVVTRLREMAVRYDLCVVLVDHSRKGGTGDMDDVRGAGAKVNAARRVLVLSRPSDEELDKLNIAGERAARVVRLDDAKSNYSASGGRAYLELVPARLENGDEVAPLRVADDLGALGADFDPTTWEHWGDFVELVRHGCEEPRRPWSSSTRVSAARLDRAMAERYDVTERRAREIIKRAAKRGAIVEETVQSEHRNPIKVWAAADGGELPDECPC